MVESQLSTSMQGWLCSSMICFVLVLTFVTTTAWDIQTFEAGIEKKCFVFVKLLSFW